MPRDVRASRLAPRIYATRNYGLTFRVPLNSFYCPLPAGWSGSDHGTVIFLESPDGCTGSGYASSSRSFEHDVARIEVYYGYDLSEPDGEETTPAPKSCDAVAHADLLGGDTPICKTIDAGRIILKAGAKYEADARAEAEFTLVTTAKRFAGDLATFRALLGSAKLCRSDWKNKNGQTEHIGAGGLCPSGATWY